MAALCRTIVELGNSPPLAANQNESSLISYFSHFLLTAQRDSGLLLLSSSSIALSIKRRLEARDAVEAAVLGEVIAFSATLVVSQHPC